MPSIRSPCNDTSSAKWARVPAGIDPSDRFESWSLARGSKIGGTFLATENHAFEEMGSVSVMDPDHYSAMVFHHGSGACQGTVGTGERGLRGGSHPKVHKKPPHHGDAKSCVTLGLLWRDRDDVE